jgi:asparaginyl-tRNA synthetase
MPHLRPRIPFNALMLRFRSKSIAAITQFFSDREFTQTHPPIITSSDCEGAGEAFNVTTTSSKPQEKLGTSGKPGSGETSFFRAPKYLTVSSQLHLEALAQSVGKVWTLSPTFRAEKSETARHLSEFYMLEAEMNFVDELEDIMSLVEDMLRHLTKSLHSTIGQEIIHAQISRHTPVDQKESDALSKELEQRWQGMMSGPWPRITYSQAIEVLQQSGQSFDHEPVWGTGLQAEHERFLASTIGKGQPVFVTKYPQSIKAFYMLPSAGITERGQTVDCFDLLVPEVCEITGGSMREHRLPQLVEAMRFHGLVTPSVDGASYEDLLSDESLGSLEWYAELRRWGSVPHGGFGLGFDRLLGYLAGVQNIREVVAFPRWVGRCDC